MNAVLLLRCDFAEVEEAGIYINVSPLSLVSGEQSVLEAHYGQTGLP